MKQRKRILWLLMLLVSTWYQANALLEYRTFIFTADFQVGHYDGYNRPYKYEVLEDLGLGDWTNTFTVDGLIWDRNNFIPVNWPFENATYNDLIQFNNVYYISGHPVFEIKTLTPLDNIGSYGDVTGNGAKSQAAICFNPEVVAWAGVKPGCEASALPYKVGGGATYIAVVDVNDPSYIYSERGSETNLTAAGNELVYPYDDYDKNFYVPLDINDGRMNIVTSYLSENRTSARYYWKNYLPIMVVLKQSIIEELSANKKWYENFKGLKKVKEGATGTPFYETDLLNKTGYMGYENSFESVVFPHVTDLSCTLSSTTGKYDITFKRPKLNTYSNVGESGSYSLSYYPFKDYFEIRRKSDNSLVYKSQYFTYDANHNTDDDYITSAEIPCVPDGKLVYKRALMMGEEEISTWEREYELPATYFLPDVIHAELQSDGNTLVWWDMDPSIMPNSEQIIGDQWHLQRSTNQYFSANVVDYYIDCGPLDQLTRFSIIDNTADDNVNTTYYYRLTRTKGEVDKNWGWAYVANTSALLAMDHTRIATANARMVDDVTAELTWDYNQPVYDSNDKVTKGVAWSKNSVIRVTRTNATNGTVVTFDIPADSLENKRFCDVLPTSCEIYTYRMTVVPGSNKYSATPIADVLSDSKLYGVNIGEIIAQNTSKGYYSDRVDVTWETDGGHFQLFLIMSRVHGSGKNFEQIDIVEANSINTSYKYTDTKAVPGVIYDYKVVGMMPCGDEVVSRDFGSVVGFQTPTGDLYGRVTYQSGQAVEDVEVRAEPSESNAIKGKSYLFTEDGELQTAPIPLGPQFSVQAWVKPTTDNGCIIGGEDFGGFNLSLWDGVPRIMTQGSFDSEAYNAVLPTNEWHHLTAVVDPSAVTLYVDGKQAYTTNAQAVRTWDVTEAMKIGSNTYTGYIDEVRVWNRTLTADEVLRDYNRYLVGNEDGLAAYYTFDYAVEDAFYDTSYSGTVYNEHHGSIMDGVVILTEDVPTSEQLGWKNVTGADGAYTIRAIPYAGNGTSYMIVPRKGNHKFGPEKELRLLNANAQSHTVNFTDESSFAVSGRVTYAGGTVPVQGVAFYIDGKAAMDGKNNMITTAADGTFTIEVPVGVHEVQARLAYHVFEGDGYIKDIDGGDRDYQDIISGIELIDNTTVRYIGRLAGGVQQEAYPIGHSLSTNNLGDHIAVTLTYPNESYKLINGDPETQTMTHFRPSNKSEAKTNEVVTGAQTITIYPNLETGEFVADVIPERFNVRVTAPGYDATSLGGQLDLTSAFANREEVRVYTDSTMVGGKWQYKEYRDTVRYNEMQKFAVRVAPDIAVNQLDKQGKEVPYIGDSHPSYSCTDNCEVGMHIWENGHYRYGIPVFSQGGKYTLRAKVTENYNYYTDTQGTAFSTTDCVPVDSVIVKFVCHPESSTPVEVEADGHGVAEYTFQCGFPDLTTAKSSIEVSAKVGDKGTWFNFSDPAFSNFLTLGTRPGNSNFVTAGPDMMLTVLRDPPGSKSYSYFESGTTVSHKTSYEGSFGLEGEVSAGFGTHTETYTFVGLGGGVSTHTQEVEFGSSLGVVHEFKGVWGNERETTTTFTTNFQTSDDPLYVGAEADVYVGYSTNITYGTATSISLVSQSRYNEVGPGYYTLLYDLGPYLPKVCKHEAVNMDQTFKTLFAYPQVYIEGQLIPNLEDMRNSLIVSNTFPRANAQERANRKKGPVYLSKLPDNDPNWGKSNTDPVFKGQNLFVSALDGPSYEIILPTNVQNYRLNEDSVQYLNQAIEGWKKVIADNEKAKLQADKIQNYSFQAGAGIEYSEEATQTHVSKSGFEITAGLHYNTTGMTEIFCIGIAYEVDEKLSTTNGETYENGETTTVKKGFVLAEEGDDDYISVDVLREKQDVNSLITGDSPMYGNFVFRTRAGATSCPYEPGYITKYYQPGTMIDAATVQIEVPKLSMESTSVRNVPSGEPAYLTMYLRNESELNQDCYFDLRIVDQTNPDGLGLYIDGAPIGNGRTIFVPAGQTTTKTLECRKASVLDYNDVKLALVSQCQSDPSTFMNVIGDTCTFSVNFTPSATKVNIKRPSSDWTYNTKLPTIEVSGKTEPQHYMDVVIDGFNVNYDNFHSVELQYKSSAQSDDNWTTLMSYYADSDLYDAAVARNENAELISATANGTLNYMWMLDAEPDQLYDLRAVGVSMVNNQRIVSESEVRSGIKDMYAPRLFGQPQPADGILGPADEIRINFNEPIASGYLTENNFQVTGIRNGARTDHSVSVEFDGTNDLLTTEAIRNFVGKDITVEMWVNATVAGQATWFNHAGTDGMSFGITADRKLQVKLGETVITSPEAVAFDANQWAHVAMVYDCSGDTPKVSAFYNFVEVIHAVDAPAYTKTGKYVFGGSLEGASYFQGKMHGARIWTKALRGVELQANSLTKLSGRELNLLACYPMDEGRGTKISDKAHSASLTMDGCLWAMPEGRAVKFNGASNSLSINVGSSPIDSQMDYTLELWLKGGQANANATILGNGIADGSDVGGSLNIFSLGFEDGKLAMCNNAQIILGRANILDDNWHHLAVAVSRTIGYGQIIIDGEVDTYFPVDNIGGIASDVLTVGARSYTPMGAGGHMADPVTDRYFNGTIDDIRLWNTYRSESILKESNNVALEGTEMGLLAYYPFEAYATNQGTQELVFSLADAKVQPETGTPVPDAVANGSLQTPACAPVKGAGEISKLMYDFVANNDAIIITLKENLNRIENTIVTFTVNGIKDLNGNEMLSPVTWTAYIDRNQLGWSDDQVNIELKAGETASFSVDAVNRGGTSVDYRIENVPSWLSISRTSGKIGPDSRQTIDFTVTDMANIGRYAEQIYLIGNNDVTESLELNVNIFGDLPDWNVNPADYQFNMSVFGQLMINGQYSHNTNDVLAAFEGPNCVGVATSTYVEEKDRYYTLLTVYSNKASGNTLSFNIWDASTGQIYVAQPSTPIAFAANAVYGTADEPIVFTTTNEGIQSIPLKVGWNWISFNVEDPTFDNVENATKGYEWQDDESFKDEANNRVATIARGRWSGSLTALNTSTMFKVMSNVPRTLRFTGPIIDPTTPLTVLGMSGSNKRWTYLPYYPQYRMSVNEAFSNYEAASGDIVKSQTAFASYSDNLGWVGSLKVLEPNNGYMLQRAASGDEVLRYPSASVGSRSSRAESDGYSYVNDSYDQNMTMIVTVEGIDAYECDLLVAKVGDERRGVTELVALDNGQLLGFLTVSGDEAAMMDIAIERDGETLATANGTNIYTSNAAVGTVESPLALDFRKDLSTNVYPRLFHDTVTIQVNADKGHTVDVVIYDTKGVRLAYFHDCAAEATRGIVWNGASLFSGVYLIDVVIDGKVEPFKVVKE